MSEFTGGQWTFRQAGKNTHASISMGGKLAIFKNKISDQDGQIMSAAPDLLKALEGLLGAYRALDKHHDCAVSAIAKARGAK